MNGFRTGGAIFVPGATLIGPAGVDHRDFEDDGTGHGHRHHHIDFDTSSEFDDTTD
jgi:hypothetical protein